MDGLQEITNTLSSCIIPNPVRPHLPKIGVYNPYPKLQSKISGKTCERVLIEE